MASRSSRYLASKVFPAAVATAVGTFVYLLVTSPRKKG